MSRRFCKRGHDTLVVGRTAARVCKECGRESSREHARRRAAARAEREAAGEACVNGHDRAVVPVIDGACSECSSRTGPNPDWDAPLADLDGVALSELDRYRLHEWRFMRDTFGYGAVEVAGDLGVDVRALRHLLRCVGWLPASEELVDVEGE